MRNQISILILLVIGLTGCFTTRYNLGGEPNGTVEEANVSAMIRGPGNVRLGGEPVDLASHCSDSGVVAVTTSGGMFGDDYKIECGTGDKMAAPVKKKGKKKRRRKKRRKRKKKTKK